MEHFGSWFCVALASCCLPLGETFSCLPEAVPVSNQRNLTNSQGDSYPVALLDIPAGRGSSSGRVSTMLTHVASRLIQEALGYKAVHDARTRSVGDTGLFILAGCEQPFQKAGCNGGPIRTHILLQPSVYEISQYNLGPRPPEAVGIGLGYETISGVHISAAVAENALQDSGLPLAFYQNWNASWFDPAKYFDSYASIPKSSLLPCNETVFGDKQLMADYVRITGDHEGLHPDGTGLCPDDYWFLAPSCRGNSSRCVPTLGGNAPSGRDVLQMLQKSAAFDMPLALAKPIDGIQRERLPSNFRMAFFNLAPGSTFLELRPQVVHFPTHDALAWSRGDLRTMLSGSLSQKVVSRDLRVLAPSVVEMLTRMEMSNAMVDQLLTDHVSSGQSIDQAVCQWLLGNREVWSSWIPDETQCSPGFGLYNISDDQFLLGRMSHADLIGCKACESGRYSAQLFDQRGYTHTCELCPVGRSQPLGAAVSCEPCAKGEFQNLKGSKTCKRCGIGTYQDQTGSMHCNNCTNDTTTVGLGSISEADCGCPAGRINIATDADTTAVCVLCQAGMQCPGLSSRESLVRGTSQLGEDFVPKVLPGYMSLTEEALDVYKCDNAEACPGGTPGSCTGSSKGVGCFECADGTQWNGEDCQPCESWIRVGWGIAIVGVCVFLPFAHTVKMNDTSPTRELVVFTLLSIFEIGGNLLQTLAITGQMTLEWPQLLVDAFSFLEVFAFEASDLGISCISGSRPLQQFGFQVAVLPAGLLWVLVTHLLLRMLSRGRSLPQLMASLGQIVVVCFSAVSNLSMVPFMCFRHPNGRYSNLQMLSIICGSHDHAAMMIMGTCLGALLCAFWAMCIWILWRLPSWSLNENYHEHVVASEFLIDKFRLDSWWFGLPLLLRGPLMSLPLLLFTNNPASQVVLMSLTLIAYIVLLSLAWPFKVPLLNAVDATCTWALILLILGGSLHLPPMDEEMLASAAVSTVGSVIFAAAVLTSAVFAVMCVGAVQLRTGQERRFAILDLARLPHHDDLAVSLQLTAGKLAQMDHDVLSEQLHFLASFDMKLLHTSLSMLALEVVPEELSHGLAHQGVSRIRKSRSQLRSNSSLRSASANSLASRSSLGSPDPACNVAESDEKPPAAFAEVTAADRAQDFEAAWAEVTAGRCAQDLEAAAWACADAAARGYRQKAGEMSLAHRGLKKVQHILYDSVSDPTDTESEQEMVSKAEARRQHCFLPSAGSAGHGTAAGCRPCAFYTPSLGCRNGTACNFCHYDHSPEERQLPKPSSRPAKGKRDKDKRRIAPPSPETPDHRPKTPRGEPRISEIREDSKQHAAGGDDIPQLKDDKPSCCARLADVGNRLERWLDRVPCLPGIPPPTCLRRNGCLYRCCEANSGCFCIGRRGMAVFGNFRKLFLLISLMLSVIGVLLRGLPAAALSTERGNLHQWPWAHGRYTCLQSDICRDIEADVYIGLEALLVESPKYRIYKAIPWNADNCIADLSSLGAGAYCNICRDASRGCAAMAFISIGCSLFNIWADVQRMRARNDHNCIKAVAIVSNVIGALQLLLAVSIFQLLCVAEFPTEDRQQTYRIALSMGKGGALIASACCINVFNILMHWCIPVPAARWKRGIEPWKDPAVGLWPPLDTAVQAFDGTVPEAPAKKGWMDDGDDDPVRVLMRAGMPRPETPDIWQELHENNGQEGGPEAAGKNRRPSLESV
ncbi:unnamed protein product [Symbiodinium sp. CCMP2592]|nr:unnamed protein product [Symbiodinium sp. CCMP2592]